MRQGSRGASGWPGLSTCWLAGKAIQCFIAEGTQQGTWSEFPLHAGSPALAPTCRFGVLPAVPPPLRPKGTGYGPDGFWAKERAAAAFKELLADKGCTAFSRWERELPKLQSDGRFKVRQWAWGWVHTVLIMVCWHLSGTCQCSLQGQR